jgi:hypothetical protein
MDLRNPLFPQLQLFIVSTLCYTFFVFLTHFRMSSNQQVPQSAREERQKYYSRYVTPVNDATDQPVATQHCPSAYLGMVYCNHL